MLAFSENIKRLRKERNLTQQEFADLIFVTRSAVSKWEQGRGTPGLETLKLIAEKFDLTLDALVSDDELNRIQSNEEDLVNNDEELNQEEDTNVPDEEAPVNYSSHKMPLGFLAGLSSVFVIFLTIAVVAVFIILDRIEGETGSRITLLSEWYQVLLLTLDAVFVVGVIGFTAMMILDSKYVEKEKITAKGVLLNKSAWANITTFFLMLLVILLVGEPIVKENEGNINYALGINPYQMVQDEDPDKDTEYFKSKYYKEDGSYDDKAMRNGSMEASRKLAAEGAVLLWNNNDALPLKEGEKLSFFGVSSKPKNWLYTGTGSGKVTTTVTDFPDLKQTFELEGKYTVNPTLWNSYSDSQVRKVLSNPFGNDKHYREFQINEKAWSAVQTAAGSSFANYGDSAIYFITRDGGEDADTWFDTSVNTTDKNVDNNYLDLAQNEIDTIEALVKLKNENVFKDVILVLNTGTPLNMKTIAKYDIDACIWAGMAGNASFYGLYDVMSGKENFSGRLPHTYVYNNDSAPSAVNTGAFNYKVASSDIPDDDFNSNTYNHQYIVYQEGIYVGYRYYETRYEDTVLNQGNASSAVGVYNGTGAWKYEDEVRFPFGYGLSYTNFEFDSSFKKVTNGYEVTVGVKNTGTIAGKTPIQIYLQKPYTDYDKQNGIEKAAIELVAYDKTDIIPAGERKEYTIFVDEYEFKSYDSYNKKTYILEKGDYYISVGANAHDALNNVLAKKESEGLVVNLNKIVDVNGNKTSGNKNLVYKETIAKDDFEKYSISPNGTKVTNQFDNADLNIYEGTKDQKVTYLSRNNWDTTYPVKPFEMEARNRILVQDVQYYSGIEKDPNLEMPLYNTITSEQGELKLIMLRGLEYNNPLWEDLLNQMSWEETVSICGIGSHAIQPVKSIDSPAVVAHDGPAGVKNDTPAKNDPEGTPASEQVNTFHAFPAGVVFAASFNDELAEEVCVAFGIEMLHAGVGEIYGTGAGIHRSAYGGRNWEYFSEDGYLSGKILAAEVKGLQSKGAIVNIKHFALNDQEIYRCGATTWANEQSIREIYLKGFEAGVTEGHANGVMSALNRIGATWAGRHKGLLTEVLRNEWGFEGLVETDAATGIYMRNGNARAEAVIAGNDLWLRGSSNVTELWGDYKDHAVVAHALRKSAHNILYVVCNSAAMNGIDASTRFEYITPWYYDLLHGAQFGTGGALLISIAVLLCCFILNKKKKEENDIVENVDKPKTVFHPERKKKLMIAGSAMLALIIASSITIPVIAETQKMTPDIGGGTSSSIPVEVILCEHKCPTCGGCLDLNNDNPGCATKCGDQWGYDVTYNVADLKVAKTGCVVDADNFNVNSFNKTNNAAISYQIHSDRAATVSLIVSVRKSAEVSVYTDNVIVMVNNTQVKATSVVPALGESESFATAFVSINLGCVSVVEGVNYITFIANGDGVKSHDFESVKLVGNPVFTLQQATAIPHPCESVCSVCKGCLDFSCYNPGCVNKCTCKSNGLPATLFWVCDERVDTHGREVNKELDGIGCTWNVETLITYEITASKTGPVLFGAVVSVDTKDVLFTDQFTLTVNGVKVTGTGLMPKGSARVWNEYHMIVVGEITLTEGRNVINISQIAKKTGEGATNCAYNFQSMIVFGDGEYNWYEKEEIEPCATCTTDDICAVCGLCEKVECKHDQCVLKCQCVGKYTFSAMDSRVLVTGADKNWTNNYVEGKNGQERDITYYIHADKDTTAELYTRVSLIVNHWEINYNKTWEVLVNNVNYESSTIHKNSNGMGVPSDQRFFTFTDEYVCKIDLKAGVNKIHFKGVGGNDALNFKDLTLFESKANLEFANYCPICEKCIAHDNCNNACSCGGYTLGFMGVDSKVKLTNSFRAYRGVIGQNGYSNESTITFKLNASEDTSANLMSLISSNTVLNNLNDIYSVKLNGDEVTTDSVLEIGARWVDYKPVSWGEMDLNKGENTIIITYKGSKSEHAYNIINFVCRVEKGTVSLV